MQECAYLPVVDGWNERSEEGAKSKRDGIAEGDAKVSDGEAKRNATDAPKDPEEERIAQVIGVCRIGLVHDAGEMGNEEVPKNRGCNDPCGEALNDPVDLPRPALDSAEWNEVSGGAEAADPVEDDA